ncbi:hypothetical protein TcWFU_007687 [Taenia crassiceps]|uniref:Uncharacterized protein n=1 Tax=Taenia crassiceps TaxID=6207 RepID=A0ABR4QLQ8_9CEST
MEFASSGEVVISDRQRLAIVDMTACFATSIYEKEGAAVAKYLSIERDADAFATLKSRVEVFRWRIVKFACQTPLDRPSFKGTKSSNRSVVASSFPSTSTSPAKRISLLPIVWTLSVLSVGLSAACLFMLVALLRLKSIYVKQRHHLRHSNTKPEALCHQNAYQVHEKFGDALNLSQASVVMEPEYHFSSILPLESRDKLVGSPDLLTTSETLPKIHTYPAVTHVPLNTPSLPRRYQHLNNDLELRTFTILPIRQTLGFDEI